MVTVAPRPEYDFEVEEVVYIRESPVVVTGRDIAFIKAAAARSPRRRARICGHPAVDDELHEMIIAIKHGCYVPPHRHLQKSESVQVVEGRGLVVFFEPTGQIRRVERLGEPASAQSVVFYRMNEPMFHTLIVESDWLVIHEATRGPFRRQDNERAPWAPREDDVEGAAEFMRRLWERLGSMGIQPAARATGALA